MLTKEDVKKDYRKIVEESDASLAEALGIYILSACRIKQLIEEEIVRLEK